jgi:hypothetical protein
VSRVIRVKLFLYAKMMKMRDNQINPYLVPWVWFTQFILCVCIANASAWYSLFVLKSHLKSLPSMDPFF